MNSEPMSSPAADGRAAARVPVSGEATVIRFDGTAGFLRLREPWEKLTQHDSRYWMQFPFVEKLIHHADGTSHLTSYLVSNGQGEPLAIVPVRHTELAIRKVHFRGVELLGSTFDPVLYSASSADFPARSPAAATLALQAVMAKLRDSSPTPAALLLGRLAGNSNALAAALSIHTRPHVHSAVAGSKWLSVDCTFEVIQQSLAKKFRASLRKSRQELCEQGTVECGVTTRADECFEQAFAEFLEIEASGWKGDAGTATGLLSVNSRPQRLFLESIARGDDTAPVELFWLKVSGHTVASQLWMRDGACRVVFKVGYREEYSRFQPGHLLLEHVIRDSCANTTLRTIDFVSDGSWFDKWRAQFSPWHYHYLPVSRVRGAIANRLLDLPSAVELRAKVQQLRGRFTTAD